MSKKKDAKVAKKKVQEGEGAPWKQWGSDLDENAVEQMRMAVRLPVAVRGALMPDAHVGYGLPIGGVLATENAVIPYAVGVDIACRMKLTVLDLPLSWLKERRERLARAIEEETIFGVGGAFKKRRQHRVLDEDWNCSPVTQRFKDKAWAQLGTSGSGNHFVEFGRLELFEPVREVPRGEYLALLSHSGSRGTGAEVCLYYSRIAAKLHPELPKEWAKLAWLEMDKAEGQEYWAAMQLMGKYAAANHELIHRHIARNLGAQVLLDLENHHNFAWREKHFGQEVIVHRKGATPAGKGMLGIIPGCMASPAFIVEGKGEPESLESASHGAGRVMSRRHAESVFRWDEIRSRLESLGIWLLSAGVDEAPECYRDIHQVMAAQEDLVRIVARFDPKIVKMAPAGEKAED